MCVSFIAIVHCQVTETHAQKEAEWKSTILRLQNELQEKSDLLLSTEQVQSEAILIKAHHNKLAGFQCILLVLCSPVLLLNFVKNCL